VEVSHGHVRRSTADMLPGAQCIVRAGPWSICVSGFRRPTSQRSVRLGRYRLYKCSSFWCIHTFWRWLVESCGGAFASVGWWRGRLFIIALRLGHRQWPSWGAAVAAMYVQKPKASITRDGVNLLQRVQTQARRKMKGEEPAREDLLKSRSKVSGAEGWWRCWLWSSDEGFEGSTPWSIISRGRWRCTSRCRPWPRPHSASDWQGLHTSTTCTTQNPVLAVFGGEPTPESLAIGRGA